MAVSLRQSGKRGALTFVPDEEYDALSIYLREINQYPLLTAKEEVDLAQQIEAGHAELAKPTGCNQTVVDLGVQAHRRFVEANLRLVVSLAQSYLQHSEATLSLLDLCQEGNIGLLRAIEKYDWRKGYKFSTCAIWWIRQAIGRAHHNQSRVVRLPEHVSEKLYRIKRACRLLVERKIDPTPEAIAAHLELPLPTVLDVLAYDYRVVSLEKPLFGAEDQSLGSLLDAQHLGNGEDWIAQHSLAERVHEVLDVASLTARERQVIELRFGLLDHHSHTLKEASEKLNVTRERIRQIEAKALKKLRFCLTHAIPDVVA